MKAEAIYKRITNEVTKQSKCGFGEYTSREFDWSKLPLFLEELSEKLDKHIEGEKEANIKQPKQGYKDCGCPEDCLCVCKFDQPKQQKWGDNPNNPETKTQVNDKEQIDWDNIEKEFEYYYINEYKLITGGRGIFNWFKQRLS